MLRDKADRAGDMAVFVAVAEAGSLSGAARRLGLTPSAVSRVVARIEARLGVQLLVRTTRTLRLTAEGRDLRACGAAHPGRSRRDRDSFVRPGLPARAVRVSAATAHGRLVIVPLLGAFVAAIPASWSRST